MASLVSISFSTSSTGKPLVKACVEGGKHPIYFNNSDEDHIRSGLLKRNIEIPSGMLISPVVQLDLAS